MPSKREIYRQRRIAHRRELLARTDGWVYALEVVEIPGVMKIGQTVRPPRERYRELLMRFAFQGATVERVPRMFVFQEPKRIEIERVARGLLGKSRFYGMHDYFTVPLEEAVALLQRLTGREPVEFDPHELVLPA